MSTVRSESGVRLHVRDVGRGRPIVVLHGGPDQRLSEQTWLGESYDLLLKLRNLRIPTLVLHGDQDFIPLAVAQHIADAIPGARLEVLPDCGHFSFLEQPEAFHAAVADFLNA